MADEKKKSYGGMAVVEGVMMRSPNHYSVACRAPDGRIFVKTEPIEKTWIGRQKWLLKPFLRGTFALLDTMGLGMRAMRIAGDVQLDPKFQPAADEVVHPERHVEKPPTRLQVFYERNQAACDKAILGATLVFSLVIGFAIFNVFPNFAGQYISEFGKSVGIEPKGNERGMFTTVLVETIKLVMFIGYVALIRRYPAIYEVFRFHGAEHQAINAMEEGVELTPENCLRQTRLHPRCGTNFALLVFIVSFLLFPFVPRDLIVPADSASWLIALTRLPVEIALLPIVAGISYEIIRLAGKFKNEVWVNIVLWPGLKTQLITTAEPEARHAEVAIAALEAAVLAEETGELTNSEDYTPVSLRGCEEPAAPNDQVQRAAQ
jgi:uncharacterized protein YqhQ